MARAVLDLGHKRTRPNSDINPMPEATEILDAARGERLEAAHDLRDAIASFGLISQDDDSCTKPAGLVRVLRERAIPSLKTRWRQAIVA